MSDETEIITKPPEHPATTFTLFLSMVGVIGLCAFVWLELFNEYLPTYGPGQQADPVMQKHGSREIAEKGVRDHYKVDYPEGDVLADVEKNLGLSSTLEGQGTDIHKQKFPQTDGHGEAFEYEFGGARAVEADAAKQIELELGIHGARAGGAP